MFDRILKEMFSQKLDESMLNEQIMREAYAILNEKLIVFGGGAKYGQIVFLSGGAGSGKGYASSTFMDSNLFKVRDVDEWKKTFLEISKLKDKYPEIRGLNLKNSEDVFALHMFIKKIKIGGKDLKSGTLDLLLKDVQSDRLPNIMFDITGKDLSDFEEVIPLLQDVGFESKNIHVAWVLTNFEVAYASNVTRNRVVPADIFLGTHQGAANTMSKLLDTNSMPKGANGRFVVVMNNRENTIMFKDGKGERKGEKVKNVKGFYYLSVKEAGKSFKPESQWKEELHSQIIKNIPGGQASVDLLRKSALGSLEKDATSDNKKDADKAKGGIDAIRRDVAKDRIKRKLRKASKSR
jgi:hypothetical protein